MGQPLSLLVMVLAQLDAGAGIQRDCQRLAADGGVGSVLAPLLEEALQIVDWQRADFATQLLAARGLTAAQCPALLHLVTPTRVVALRGPVTVSWDVADEPLCFRTLHVQAKDVSSHVELDTVHCADVAPKVQLEDFDFDGMSDVRIVTKLTFNQSRRFDVVLLQRDGHRFERSAALSQLDDLQRHPTTRQLSSRVLDSQHRSRRVLWRWQGDKLSAVK